MLKGHLPRVIYHQTYWYTQIQRVYTLSKSTYQRGVDNGAALAPLVRAFAQNIQVLYLGILIYLVIYDYG
jgi:hypothetical protein